MLEVVILAAGRGTRMHSQLPKVLHTLAGKPLAGHVLAVARNLNPRQIHMVIGHGGDQVRTALAAPDVLFHEQQEQLGTGHAVQQALPHCDPQSTVLVLFGDVPLIQSDTLRRLLSKAADTPAMLASHLDDPAGYGRVIRGEQGDFRGVVEHKDASTEVLALQEVNTGVLAAPAALLTELLAQVNNDNSQNEYYLPDALGLAVARGMSVGVELTTDAMEMMGVNDRLQLEALERLVQRQTAESLLRAGVGIKDRDRIDVRGSLVCGENVSIDVNVVFEGDVRLGDGVVIGPNCVINDAVIGDGATILAFSHIEKVELGSDCRVGPYARLRPGTILESGARIGNFVETKNTRFGEGAKANHLAYVGDASIGAKTNIGAGTITCNYDGVNKHRTELGEGVFIGSNSTLVAPVTVADGGFVAAGSTITKNVESNALAVARARQKTIRDWQRPGVSEDD